MPAHRNDGWKTNFEEISLRCLFFRLSIAEATNRGTIDPSVIHHTTRSTAERNLDLKYRSLTCTSPKRSPGNAVFVEHRRSWFVGLWSRNCIAAYLGCCCYVVCYWSCTDVEPRLSLRKERKLRLYKNKLHEFMHLLLRGYAPLPSEPWFMLIAVEMLCDEVQPISLTSAPLAESIKSLVTWI